MNTAVHGFAIFFNRHQRRWGWKEKNPHPEHQTLGHVVVASGYSTQMQAKTGIRLELCRRQKP